MNHHPGCTRSQIASQGIGWASDKPSTDRHHLPATIVVKQSASHQALRSLMIMLTTPAMCLACIASNLVKLHLLSLHIIHLNMTCLPFLGTYYYICLLTMFLHQTNVLVYPSSITSDEAGRQGDYSSFKECSVSLPTWFSRNKNARWR